MTTITLATYPRVSERIRIAALRTALSVNGPLKGNVKYRTIALKNLRSVVLPARPSARELPVLCFLRGCFFSGFRRHEATISKTTDGRVSK